MHVFGTINFVIFTPECLIFDQDLFTAGQNLVVQYQEGNKLKRQTILSFTYPIYNHNWRNNIYIYITRLASNEKL